MVSFRRSLLFFFLLLVLAGLGAVFLWPGAQPLTDRYLAPRVAARIGATLDANATLEELRLGWGRVVLKGLHLEREDAWRLRLPEAVIRTGLIDLLRKRIEYLEVKDPSFSWHSAPPGDGGRKSGEKDGGADLPRRPPLTIGRWKVLGGEALFQWEERKLRLERMQASGGLGQSFDLEIRAEMGSRETVLVEVAGEGRWHEGPELTLTSLRWAGRSILEQRLVLVPGGDPKELAVGLEHLDSEMAEGMLRAFGEDPPWPEHLAWSVEKPFLGLEIRDGKRRVELRSDGGSLEGGDLRLGWQQARIEATPAPEGWEWQGKLLVSEETRLEVDGLLADGKATGSLRFRSTDPAELVGSLHAELPERMSRLTSLLATGTFEVHPGRFAFRSSSLVITFEDDLRLTGTLAVSRDDQRFDLSFGEMDLAFAKDGTSLAKASLAVALPPGNSFWRGNWEVTVPSLRGLGEGLGRDFPSQEMDLRSLRVSGRLSTEDHGFGLPGVKLAGRVVGSDLNGRLTGELDVDLDESIRLAISSLHVDQVEYLPPQGTVGLTGGRLEVKGEVLLSGRETVFELQGAAGTREALYQHWYGDLEGLPLHFQAQGSITGREAVSAVFQANLAGMVVADGEARWSEERLEGAGTLRIPSLKGDFRTHLPRLAGGLVTIPEDLELAGALSLSCSGTLQGKTWGADLVLAADNLSLQRGDAHRLAGFSGELPLLLRREREKEDCARSGRLEWQDITLGPFGGNPGRLALTATCNSWSLREPFTLAAAGGTVILDSWRLDFPAGGPSLEASLRIDAVRLGELARALGWPEMGGRLSAELDTIRYGEDQFTSQGGVLASAFGGELQVRNLRVEAPFSDYPTYYGDLDFSRIDLEVLTGTFEFGEINGIADGFVHDLRLFDGLPTSFHARFETREKGGRTISVKAIRNLNAFSQGGLSAALSQGIYRFIDFYRYRKIGFECRLKNDVFYLEGTARPDSDRYLVDGSLLPPRIDVVTSAKAISFQELVRRLRRIQRTGN